MAGLYGDAIPTLVPQCVGSNHSIVGIVAAEWVLGRNIDRTG